MINNLINSSNQLLSYTLVVTSPAYGAQSAYCAYQFAQTLLSTTSHTLKTIFFYADGVYNANHFNDPANDEFDITRAWQQLAQTYSLKLAVCIAAGQRRGITEHNIADHFSLAGLGELSETIANTDRVIQF